MGLQITVSIHQPAGNTITKDSVISYDTTFKSKRVAIVDGEGIPTGAYEVRNLVNYSMKVFQNAAAYESGKPELAGGITEFDSVHTKDLSPAEYAELANPASNTFALVEGWLVEHLETKVGDGKVIHVTFAI